MKYNNIIFLVDFDRTIFDTDRFKIDLKNIFINSGVKEKDFQKAYKKTNPYSILTHLNNIGADATTQEIILDKINKFTKNLDKYVFNDAQEFLDFSAKNKIVILLVTYGNKNFQEFKAKKSHVFKYFSDIYYTPKHRVKTKLFRKIEKEYKGKKLVIIDDMLENTLLITNDNPHLYSIRINRKKNEKKPWTRQDNFFEVKKLSLIHKIIPLI